MMKIIDLLNKIANGEIETFYKFKYRNKIVTIEFLIDNYLFLEILNDEIEFIEDMPKEEKKIPEKVSLEIDKFEDSYYDTALIKVASKIDELIDYLDYLKSKGE